jgi:hypothetical protein
MMTTLHASFRKKYPGSVEELDAFLGFLASRLAASDYLKAKSLLHEAIDPAHVHSKDLP